MAGFLTRFRGPGKKHTISLLACTVTFMACILVSPWMEAFAADAPALQIGSSAAGTDISTTDETYVIKDGIFPYTLLECTEGVFVPAQSGLYRFDDREGYEDGGYGTSYKEDGSMTDVNKVSVYRLVTADDTSSKKLVAKFTLCDERDGTTIHSQCLELEKGVPYLVVMRSYCGYLIAGGARFNKSEMYIGMADVGNVEGKTLIRGGVVYKLTKADAATGMYTSSVVGAKKAALKIRGCRTWTELSDYLASDIEEGYAGVLYKGIYFTTTKIEKKSIPGYVDVMAEKRSMAHKKSWIGKPILCVNYSEIKKKNQIIKRDVAFRDDGGSSSKVIYKKIKGNRKIKVSKSGNITLKKGLKKGVYKVRVRASVNARGYHKATSKIVTLKIVVHDAKLSDAKGSKYLGQVSQYHSDAARFKVF